MVDVAQLVRATDCGSVGRGFEPHLPPTENTQDAHPASFFIPENHDIAYLTYFNTISRSPHYSKETPNILT